MMGIVVAVLAILLIVTYDKWHPLELKAYDLRFQIIDALGIGRSSPTGEVVVVGIEERHVIQEKPVIFMYPDIGLFLQRMRDYRVQIVGLDLIPVHKLSEKLRNAMLSVYDEKRDKRYIAISEEIGARFDKALLASILDVTGSMKIVQAYHGNIVPYYYEAIPFMQSLYPADVVLTDGQTIHGQDGIIRKQKIRPAEKNSFAGKIYSLISGNRYKDPSVKINYSLSKNIPFYCFSDVMKGKIGGERFSGKTVLLGYISGYEDAYLTPLRTSIAPSCGSALPVSENRFTNHRLHGFLIHATLVETLLTDTPLRDAPKGFMYPVLLILIALAFTATMLLKPIWGITVVLSMTTVFLIGNIILFSWGHVVPIFPHSLSPFLTLTFVYPFMYFSESKIRQRIYKTFSYYIDNEVLDSLLEKDPASLLKGEYKDVCILFLDIRDFTKLSHSQNAENIVKFLNLYFAKVTEIIQSHKGFVNKFIGDGVLAFFATGENPILQATVASREITKETERFNREGIAKDLIGEWHIRIGIGIHYGKVVMGNIGSEKKMDFTIIGDHVNIASRIEGLTKQAGVTVLLSEEAYKLVGHKDFFDFVGEFSVKGVDKPIAVYTIKQEPTKGGLAGTTEGGNV